jgi:hypothetical protein
MADQFLFAVVGLDGTLIRGRGVSEVSKPFPTGAVFRVVFESDITDCIAVGNCNPFPASPSGGVFAMVSVIDAHTVQVVTCGLGGSIQFPFHLLVLVPED